MGYDSCVSRPYLNTGGWRLRPSAKDCPGIVGVEVHSLPVVGDEPLTGEAKTDMLNSIAPGDAGRSPHHHRHLCVIDGRINGCGEAILTRESGR